MDNSRASESYQYFSNQSGFYLGSGDGVDEDEKMSLADFCRRQKTSMVDDH
jgi:hypothetical protein